MTPENHFHAATRLRPKIMQIYVTIWSFPESKLKEPQPVTKAARDSQDLIWQSSSLIILLHVLFRYKTLTTCLVPDACMFAVLPSPRIIEFDIFEAFFAERTLELFDYRFVLDEAKQIKLSIDCIRQQLRFDKTKTTKSEQSESQVETLNL
jgi:hypothetical protein